MLGRLFRRKKVEHAVLLIIPTEGQWPDEGERGRVFELEDRLEEAIDRARAGQFDGDEWGEGGGTVFMYGPDADRLWDAIEGVVREAGLPRGSHAIKRYGEPGAREERVELG